MDLSRLQRFLDVWLPAMAIVVVAVQLVPDRIEGRK